MITYSSAKFVDKQNASMTIKIRDVVDSSKLYAFCKVIEGASSGSFVSRRFEEAEATPVAAAVGSVIGRVALLTMKDDEGQIYKVTVPSVNASLIEVGDNPKNQKLDPAQATTIATAYGTATGKTGVMCIGNAVKQRNYA